MSYNLDTFCALPKKEDSGLKKEGSMAESRRTANVTSKEGAEKQRAYIFQDNFLL